MQPTIVAVQLLSHVRLSATPWTVARQASLSFTIFWSLFKLMSIELVMLSNHLILYHPLLLLSISPASGSFPVSQLLVSGGQSIGASASVLSMNIQDSQESSPIPHFKSINYSALSLYGPILTSIHDSWKNHSFDYRDLCWESNVSVFLIHCIGLS